MLAECSRCAGLQWRFVDAEHGERDLTVLALPHKVGLALAAADLVLLEAADRHPVGVCLAARRALHLERVVEGRVLGVERAQVGHAVQLGLEGECEHHA